jgi:hypothetical protein
MTGSQQRGDGAKGMLGGKREGGFAVRGVLFVSSRGG